MKKNVKSMIVIFCLIVIMLCSVFTTLAYLTDSKTVTNTFTVGNVQIKLDEATLVPETGKVNAAVGRTETGNTDVRLIPGREIEKDPTVTVLKESENCYVRMKVTVTDETSVKAAFRGLTYDGGQGTYLDQSGVFQLTQILDGWNSQDWVFAGYSAVNGNAVYEFRYVGALAPTGYVPRNETSDTVLPDLFTSLTIPGAMTGSQLKNLENVDIVVTAEAIQAEGFTDAASAWASISN